MDIKQISNKLKDQLLAVKPSRDWTMEYRPCQVKLKNGEILDRVYLSASEPYMRTWGVMPDQDSGKKYVLIEDVEEIKESPYRMPVHLANKLYKAGESGMGYCLYKMQFDNGKTIEVSSGNAVDFPPIPNGLKSENIKDVFPHEGSRKNPINSHDYTWCLFKWEIPEIGKEETTANIDYTSMAADVQPDKMVPKSNFWSKLKSLWS
ncbi:hypothetical protein [Croceivirga thetidis]|uniref:START domain-containing protein n=1 Tax=Croceivirga thetidis TaxID=2721623 RepID=A0ABX1GMY5_9FLAO|nr:hypothetical protein [Croceivirga thetidis]NKI30430.1 hypothetical protein [Croceivirga thetidis]